MRHDQQGDLDAEALLIYASGTTGKPKDIIYSHTDLMHGSFFVTWQCDTTSIAISVRGWAHAPAPAAAAARPRRFGTASGFHPSIALGSVSVRLSFTFLSNAPARRQLVVHTTNQLATRWSEVLKCK